MKCYTLNFSGMTGETRRIISTAVQKHLLKLGYKWESNQNIPEYTDKVGIGFNDYSRSLSYCYSTSSSELVGNIDFNAVNGMAVTRFLEIASELVKKPIEIQLMVPVKITMTSNGFNYNHLAVMEAINILGQASHDDIFQNKI